MKRLIIISLVIVTIFTFVGCGTESNSSSKTSTTVTTTVDSVKSNKYYNDIDINSNNCKGIQDKVI